MKTRTLAGCKWRYLPPRAMDPFDRAWRVSLEFKPQDAWLGVYWQKRGDGDGGHSFDVWVCLLPCLPIHFSRRVLNGLEW